MSKDYKKLEDIPINETPAETQIIRHSDFTGLCECCEKGETCLLGAVLPCALFGRTYERAGFGSFCSGCSKYLAISVFYSILMNAALYSIQYNRLLGPLSEFKLGIHDCSIQPNCFPSFSNDGHIIDSLNSTNLLANDCEIPDGIRICQCLDNVLLDQCKFEKNIKTEVTNMLVSISLVGTLGGLLSSSTYGFFLGNYRKKIGDQLNIDTGDVSNFLFHCVPFINPCALCQEANTVDRNIIMASQPVPALNV